MSTAPTTAVSRSRPEPVWATGSVVKVQGAWAEVTGGLWAWRPRAEPGMVLHGVRGAEELDLRVDLRAAVRAGAFVPGVVERKEPYGLFVRVRRAAAEKCDCQCETPRLALPPRIGSAEALSVWL